MHPITLSIIQKTHMRTMKLLLLISTFLFIFSYSYSQTNENKQNNKNKIHYNINVGYSLILKYLTDDYSENLDEHYKDLRNAHNTGVSMSYRISDKVWLGGAYRLSYTSSNKTYQPIEYGYYGGEGGSVYGDNYGLSNIDDGVIDEQIYVSYLAPTIEYNILSIKNQSVSIGGGIGYVRYNSTFALDKYDLNWKTKGNTIGLSPQVNYHFFINQHLSIDFQLAFFISYLKNFTTDNEYLGEIYHENDFSDLYSLNRIDLSIGLNLWK